MKSKMIDNTTLTKLKAAAKKDLDKYYAQQSKIIEKGKTIGFLDDECSLYLSERTFAMIDKAIEKENA